MSVIGKIFGSEKAIEKVSSGIDKAFFTKEEKSEQWIETLKAYEPFKLAQRLIALLVTSAYLLVWLMCALMMFLGLWFENNIELSKQIAEWNNETLGIPFIIIISFYFAGGAAEGVIGKFKRKAQ